jgi:hypothetical protein
MLPLDLILTVTIIATVHFILGLFLGDFIARKRELPERDSESDSKTAASLYALEIPNDRRSARSFKYERMQLIAPVVGTELPSPADFFEVPFDDLSVDRFSFFVNQKLDCEQIVARLGAAPNIVPVLARVVHQRTIQRDGDTEILVSCQVLRRTPAQSLEQNESKPHRLVPTQLELALAI